MRYGKSQWIYVNFSLILASSRPPKNVYHAAYQTPTVIHTCDMQISFGWHSKKFCNCIFTFRFSCLFRHILLIFWFLLLWQNNLYYILYIHSEREKGTQIQESSIRFIIRSQFNGKWIILLILFHWHDVNWWMPYY